METHITPYNYSISKAQREKLLGHKPLLIWFTGLSGSGKSTIANALENLLHAKGIKTYTLDGDVIRSGLNSDLQFTPEHRAENIRRIAEVANLMLDAGLVVLAAFVSPYKKDRAGVRKIVNEANFVEIYINTPLEVCEQRDVKGLYKKARAGIIKNMTGISAPYEAPENPDLEIHTANELVEAAAKRILHSIMPKLLHKHE
ncbi:adenylyl-sulfate kinase [Bizionia sediminis]|uniref:Adenylyl-sulfate kinase n=1 Tax=Bizionia sediminis TaxID=1737064 RepID=A0ABW5KUX4_9FLAO